jgi:hypothetical protein
MSSALTASGGEMPGGNAGACGEGGHAGGGDCVKYGTEQNLYRITASPRRDEERDRRDNEQLHKAFGRIMAFGRENGKDHSVVMNTRQGSAGRHEHDRCHPRRAYSSQ